MELGGWSNYEMVLRYAHLAPDHLAHHAEMVKLWAQLPKNPVPLSTTWLDRPESLARKGCERMQHGNRKWER
jgi:hypothetical protein